MHLAQTEIAAQAAKDLLNAQEVLPFFQAALLLAGVGVVFFFVLWQKAAKEIVAMHVATQDRQQRMIDALTGKKEGDSRG